MMMRTFLPRRHARLAPRAARLFVAAAAIVVGSALFATPSPPQTTSTPPQAAPQGTTPPPGPAQPQQPTELSTTISSGEAGAPPRFAVPDFLALSNDAETESAAKTIAQVLWDDLSFEREFALIPRDTYTTIPRPAP